MPKHVICSRKRRQSLKKLHLQNIGRHRSSALVEPTVEPSGSTTRHGPVPAKDTSTMPKYGVSCNRRIRKIYRRSLFKCPPKLVEPTASTSRDVLLPGETELPDNTMNISTMAKLRRFRKQINQLKAPREKENISESVDPGGMLQIKEEWGDSKLDIGSTTLQHMDSHYRMNQGSSAVTVKQESAVENNSVDDDAVDYSSIDETIFGGVKQELLEMEVMDLNLRPVCGMPILSHSHSTMEEEWTRPLSPIGTDDVVSDSILRLDDCPNAILKSFIAIYESLPQLWDVTNKSYRSKSHHDEGLDKLLQIYRKWKPDATRDDVRKKISNLRANFQYALKKIELSKLSGTGSDEHKATSWTFSALQLLTKLENFHLNNNEMFDPERESQISTMSNSSDTRQTFPLLNAAENQPRPSKGKKSSTTAKQNELLDRVSDLLSQSQRAQASSPVDPLAAHWTQKLQKLNPAQRICAEKAIHDILFEAELNHLHRHSVQINNISTLPSASSTLYPNMSPVSPAHVIEYPIHEHGPITKSLPDNTMECVSLQTPHMISTLPQSSSVNFTNPS